MEAVYALWDDLDQFSSDHADAAMEQLCQRLKSLLKADIWISFPLNADAESVFMIDRMGPAPHFTLAEVKLSATIHRGIRGFHRRLFMDRALLIGGKPLSPVARRVLQKLLTGMSEKEIAESLGQSASTTHKYVKTIYARFGVNARAALMSLWLQH